MFGFLIFISCTQKLIKKPIEYVVFGEYSGECNRNCAIMYKYCFGDTSNTLLIDTSDSYFKNSGEILFNKVSCDSNKVNIVKRMTMSLPKRLLDTFIGSCKFGCPDCGDGGGIYLEFGQNGAVKKFYFDTQIEKLPDDLKNFVDSLKADILQISMH